MKQVNHLHAFVVIQIAFKQVAPCRSNQLGIRLLIHKIIQFLQLTFCEIFQHPFHMSFGFAHKNTIGMKHGFFGMKHRRNTAKQNLFPLFTIDVGNFPSAFNLGGEHHRNTNQISIIVKN